MTRHALLAAVVALAAGCDTLSPPPPSGGLRSVPLVVQQQAQRSALGVIDLLNSGSEETAKAELKRILALDPYNKLAQNLQRQITADPTAVLGRDWFIYVVRPNDTLSSLAGRYLGDPNAFYILARYNEIRVPNQMASGQQIRIPGRAPAPVAPPVAVNVEPRRPNPPAPVQAPAESVRRPAPAEAVRHLPSPPAEAPRPSPAPAEAARSVARAPEVPRPAAPAPSSVPPSASAAEQALRPAEAAERDKLVAQHSAAARGALARQDLDGSIRLWERVLAIDPGNDTARFERQRAIALREKVRALK